MSKYRTSALNWWIYDLAKYEKQDLTDVYFNGRIWHGLTGLEIESIWKIETVK